MRETCRQKQRLDHKNGVMMIGIHATDGWPWRVDGSLGPCPPPDLIWVDEVGGWWRASVNMRAPHLFRRDGAIYFFRFIRVLYVCQGVVPQVPARCNSKTCILLFFPFLMCGVLCTCNHNVLLIRVIRFVRCISKGRATPPRILHHLGVRRKMRNVASLY
jgi:hypothetical protein